MILGFGGEMGFFIPADGDTIETTDAGSYDTSFSRGSTRMNEGPTYAETPDIGDTLLNAWMHFTFEIGGGLAGGSNEDVLIWKDDAGTDRIKITYDKPDADFDLRVWYDIGAGWVQAGSTVSIDLRTMQTFDLNVVCASANGSIKLYISGTERLSVSLNTTAIAQLNKAQFHAFFDSSGGVTRTNVSQVVIADETTIGMRVMTLYASGAGNDTAWTGAYTDIDELAYSDADFINSSVADQVENFAGTLVSSIEGLNIRAVCVTARAKRGATGPQNFQLNLRSGGANYFSGNKDIDTGYRGLIHVWETNPATGSAWTAAEIATGSSTSANIQFGVKSIA